MEIYGLDLLDDATRLEGELFKLILNEKAIAVFPAANQHREQKFPGLSFADDSLGNALAATLMSDTLDIRLHRDFSEQRVRQIVTKLLQMETLGFLRTRVFRYGGKSIKPLCN